MSDVDQIDETLDQLELTVEGLTTSTNLDALRYVYELGTTPGCSRHSAEAVKYIAEMYLEAEADLLAGIGHIEDDHDEDANEYLGQALVHLDRIAEIVNSVTGRKADTPQRKLTRFKA